MVNKNKNCFFDHFINLLLCVSMSFSLIYALTDSLHFEYTATRIISYISILLLLFTLFFYNKVTTVISDILLIITAVAVFYKLGENTGFTKSQNIIQDYISWLGGYITGYNELDKTYEFITVILLCSAITLLVFIFTCKWFNFFVILAGGVSLFVFQWIMDYFVSYASFYTFLFSILIYYFRFIHSRKVLKEHNKYSGTASFTLQIVPLSVIVILTAYFLPSGTEPMEWKWLSKRVDAFVDYFNNTGFGDKRFEYFSVASSGFGDDGILGGRVDLDDTHVLSVDSPRPVYLKGSVCPTYNGHAWTGSNNNLILFSSDYSILENDLSELTSGMWALSGGDSEYLDKYFYDDHLVVTFENLRTKSLFILQNLYEVKTPEDSSKELYIDDSGIMSVDKTAKKGFSYTLDAYSPNYNAEGFSDILRKSKQGLYKSLFDQINKDCTVFVLGKDMFGDSVLYRQNISEGSTGYSQVAINDTYKAMDPDDFRKSIEDTGYTVRVVDDEVLNDTTASKYFDYTTKINAEINVEGLEKPLMIYDLEELQALNENMKMLSEKAVQVKSKYLQLPANLPARIKELALSITSIYENDYDKAKAIEKFFSANNFTYTLSPSRTPRGRDFVDYFLFDSKEGYCTYYASAMTILLRSAGIPARYVEGYVLPPEPESSTTYKVTNEQAHAWVEAYFEGYGWLQFEPTPPFTSVLYKDTDSTSTYDGSFLGNPNMLDYLNRMKMYGEDNAPVINSNMRNLSKQKKADTRVLIAIISTVLLLLTMLIIIFNAFRHRIMLFRAKKTAPKKSVLALYKYYLKILSAMKLELKPGETPYQFSGRVDSYLTLYKPNGFRNVTDIFVEARYGDKDISVKDRKLVCDFYAKLRDKTKDEMGKFVYFIRMYILGRL